MSENKSSRQLLAALLQQAGREGLGAGDLSGMFAELTSGAHLLDQDFEVIADGDVHGAMTDGSKRRMVDEASGTTGDQDQAQAGADGPFAQHASGSQALA